MKNKVTSIILIIITIINITGVSKASILDKTSKIIAGWYGDIPYSYKGEEKKAVRRSCNGLPVYTTKKSNVTGGFYPIEVEIYQNEKIKNIIKNGYGCKTEEELECLNMVEAFLATQEAIYITLENRNIEDYQVDQGEGDIIINATKKILKNASENNIQTNKLIEINEKSSTWKEDELDNNHKYKEFTVNASNIEKVKLEIMQGEDVTIKDNLGNLKQEFHDQDTFRLIVPTNIEQSIQIKASYKEKGITVYACTKDGENNKYLIAEESEETVEKQFGIDITKNSKLEIINQDKETEQPIQGNVFSILKEDGGILEDNLITNEQGKINIMLNKGVYYLKQNSAVSDYSINKGLIQITIEDVEPVNIKIESTKTTTEETTNVEKQINVVEENKNITENNITEVSNITVTNLNKEIINQTNETNLNNVNHFTNTINRKNIKNLQKENFYENEIQEEYIQNLVVEGENRNLSMTRQDYINYIDMIMANSSKIPILPVASK